MWALLFATFVSTTAYEVLPGFSEYGVNPRMNVDSEKMKFAFGTIKDTVYGQPQFMQIPTGPGTERLHVPKAFYHYSERDIGATSNWGLPDDSQLMSTKMLMKNNQREINGMYLPLPNMDPINLHFITQKTFEKGLDTHAQDDTPDGSLASAKKLCRQGDESACELALLHYHRVKTQIQRKKKAPLHEQLMTLGDLDSTTKLRDREGTGMGVVVAMPGYDPVYIGASLDNNNDGDYRVRFAPPS